MQPVGIISDTIFQPDFTASAQGELTNLYLLALTLAATFAFATYLTCYFRQFRRLYRFRRNLAPARVVA